jgi:hypothetical protein
LLSLFFFFFLGASITAGGMFLFLFSSFIGCCLLAFADLVRLDGRVPHQCPPWRC